MTWQDDLLLVGIADASVRGKGFWLDTWLRGYPTAAEVVCAADEAEAVWQARINAALSDHQGPVFLVGHGVGVQAVLAWVAQASLRTQGQVKGAILAAPVHLPEAADGQQAWQRARVCFPTALVCSDNHPSCTVAQAQALADCCGARLLNQGSVGAMVKGMGTWEWGMKLMQEMLLA